MDGDALGVILLVAVVMLEAAVAGEMDQFFDKVNEEKAQAQNGLAEILASVGYTRLQIFPHLSSR